MAALWSMSKVMSMLGGWSVIALYSSMAVLWWSMTTTLRVELPQTGSKATFASKHQEAR